MAYKPKTKHEARMLDTILMIKSVYDNSDIYFLNLELRKCGFFLTIPELRIKLEILASDNLIKFV